MPAPAEPSNLKEPTSLLLRQYVRSGSQAAFAKLVERYGGLVYAAALRRTGGREAMAEDISQTVFADLARRAPSLAEDDRLGAWLHRRACMAAGDAMKAENRRLRRETTAALMNTPAVDEPPVWEGLAPVLDESLNALKEKDRAALVLRFFEGLSLREVGQSLGIGEDAAQKRISRATEKLRLSLTKRGLAFSAAVLAACLKDNTSAAVPEGFAGRMLSRVPGAAAGPAALIWKLLPNVAPAAAGVLVVALASVFPLMAREKRLANGMAVPSRAGSPASSAGPARTYTPGLSLDETIDRLLDSFAARRNAPGYRGSLVYLQRLALVSLVPSGRQTEALRLLIARGEKRGLPVWSLCSSEASFISDQWIVPLMKTNSEALFEIAGEIKEDAFWFMIPGFLLAHGPSIPRPQQLNLALHMLQAAPKHRDLLDTMAALYSGSGPRLSPFKPLVKEEDRVRLLNQAMEQMRSGGHLGWGMAAAACARKDAEFITVLDACRALPFSDSREVWEYTVKTWTRSAFGSSSKDGLIPAGLRQWVEKQEGKARDKAAVCVFSNAPWLSIPPKENIGWEERADWTLAQLSRPSLMISEGGGKMSSFPKSWGRWLQKHPEVLEGQGALMPGIISSIVSGSEPTPEKLAELRPLFDAWRRTDPKAVEAAAHDPNPRQKGIAKIIQKLSSETP